MLDMMHMRLSCTHRIESTSEIYMNGKSVSNIISLGMINGLENLGYNSDVVLHKCGISKFELHKENGRIPAHSHYKLLTEFLPHQAKFLEYINMDGFYSIFPDLFSLCLNERSTLDAIVKFLKYRVLIGDCDDFNFKLRGDGILLEYTDTNPYLKPANTSSLSNFLFIKEIIKFYLPHVFIEAGFVAHSHLTNKQINDAMQIDCKFNQSSNYLVVKTDKLNLYNQSFNEKLHPFQEKSVIKLINSIEVKSTLSSEVESLVAQLLSDEKGFGEEIHVLDYVCIKLKISRWTLNNRLNQEGKCFSDIYNQVRMRKAYDLLTKTTKSMREISELTYFSSQSVFSRFFKHHTNMSPANYRKSLQKI